MPALYHYSTEHHLPAIRRAGYLKVTESNVSIETQHAGADVVWLTDDPDAARLGHGLNLNPGIDKTAVRFEVDAPEAVRWLDSPEYAAMDPEWRRIFIEAGGGPQAARRWWISYTPIRQRAWREVRVQGKPLILAGAAFGIFA